MELIQVVEKLLGPIEPIGETGRDEERYENLKAMMDLVEDLLFQIQRVAECRSRPEYSMSRAGHLASEFLKQVSSAVTEGASRE